MNVGICKRKRTRNTVRSGTAFLSAAEILIFLMIGFTVPINAETAAAAVSIVSAESAETAETAEMMSDNCFGMHFGRPLGLIVLDPGHGGKDPGAVHTCTYDGDLITVEEKSVNLAIAEKLRERISADYPDIDIVMTRDDDTFVSLWERARIANEAEAKAGTAKVFISIHANAFSSGMVKGFEIWNYGDRLPETFIVSSAGEASIDAYAEELNTKLLNELHQCDGKLAETLLNALDIGIGAETYNRGIKQGNLYVLRHTFMPSVLVETGFITNQEEAANLTDDGYQDRIAASLKKGIERYAGLSADAEPDSAD